jgi:hypothetical protein|tara:strand:- start:500 stop:637 length:138 start_codon:yes stop_codon:yes gene_type:complete
MFETVKKKITEPIMMVLKESMEKKAYPRTVAMDIARRIVERGIKK